MWIVISDSLDINFIHGRSCKKFLSWSNSGTCHSCQTMFKLKIVWISAKSLLLPWLRTIADCSGFSISHFVWTAAHLTLGYAYHTIAFFSGVDLVQQTLALLQQFMEELVPQTEKHHFLRTPALCDFLLYVGFMPFSFMDFSFYFINSSGSVFSVNSLLE